MKHLSQDELVLLHYGELGDSAADADAARAHLEACDRCRAERDALGRVLGAVELAVPEPAPGYEDRVYAVVTERIGDPAGSRSGSSFWSLSGLRPLLAAAAVVLVATLAFWFGREQGRSEQALSAEQRERILLLAVSEHLERSERVLQDVVNTRPAASLELGPSARAAERLLTDTRIYRATARGAGREHLASVLDELERVLADLANSPDTVSGPEFNTLWRRIQANGLLIKVRIAETEARDDLGKRRPTADADHEI